MKILVIGYGNQSRRDDGAGWLVIERLAALGLPDVELQAAHQLEVDVAETISRFDVVIFVDAAVTDSPHAVTRTLVHPNPESRPAVAGSHCLASSDVLALCRTLYGKEPQGMLFSIRGLDFGFGTGLSSATEGWALEVVSRIVQLLADLQHPQTITHPEAPTGCHPERSEGSQSFGKLREETEILRPPRKPSGQAQNDRLLGTDFQTSSKMEGVAS